MDVVPCFSLQPAYLRSRAKTNRRLELLLAQYGVAQGALSASGDPYQEQPVSLGRGWICSSSLTFGLAYGKRKNQFDPQRSRGLFKTHVVQTDRRDGNKFLKSISKRPVDFTSNFEAEFLRVTMSGIGHMQSSIKCLTPLAWRILRPLWCLVLDDSSDKNSLFFLNRYKINANFGAKSFI